MKCDCGKIMDNSINRIKDYGNLLKDVHKNTKDFKCSNEDLDSYKNLLRDSLNSEKMFSKLVEKNHIKYCK